VSESPDRPFRKPPPVRASRHARAWTPAVIGRVVGLALLTYLAWRVIAGGLAFPRPSGLLTILDGANFVFHEGGHVIFVFFGEFVSVLGGSLNQVLVPAALTGYFLWHRQRGSAAATMFWTGQSITGVAVYAADAKVMRLPLHGGDGPAVHDWHRLLTWTGLLDSATGVGVLFFAVAIAAMLAGLALLALDTLRVATTPPAPEDPIT
jgi:hypothetical protein